MTSLAVLDRYLHAGDRAVADRVAVADHHGGGWAPMTYGELDRRSSAVAGWLAAQGVEPGDRVVLLAESGGDWAAAFLGILRRGAIAVPLDVKLGAGELAPLVARSEPSAALVSKAATGRWADAAVRAVPVLDTGERAREAAGREADVDRPLSEPAVVVWTSGTTGEPKGVTLSLANLAYVARQSGLIQGARPEGRWLSVLPPNHLLELCCGLLPALEAASTTFVAGTIVPHELASMITECRVDQMVVVPVVVRLLERRVESQARKADATGAYLRATMAVAHRVPSRRLRRLAFLPVHRRLGGRFRTLYCGGAPLEADVVRFFERLGIEVFQGYGLTEAAPAVTMNCRRHNRPGSVGRALPGTEVRISPAGEILVRGPGIMIGYWNDPAATRAAVDDDGWLHTGDLGHLDPDGYLFVTGRAKSLIVLDSGKKVAPEEVEAELTRSELFAEVCVVGLRDGHRTGEQVCAVVVPAVPLSRDAAEEEVSRVTAGLSGFKRPTAVRILDRELPKTPKQSHRRAEIARMLEETEARR